MKVISTDKRPRRRAISLFSLLLAGACSEQSTEQQSPRDKPVAPTNRIAVPEVVQRNLGIEFVQVQRRRISATLRVPGHFQLLPSGHHEYRAQLTGRLELAVEPLQVVAKDDRLYRIDSPDWRATQRRLQELTAAVANAESRQTTLLEVLAAHAEHEASLLEATRVMAARIEQLEQIGTDVGGQAAKLAAARVQLAVTSSQVAEAREAHATMRATISTLKTTLNSDRNRLQLAIDAAAVITGVPAAALATNSGNSGWRFVEVIEVRANTGGIIDKLPVATGGWLETGDLVATTVDPNKLWFHARGLQSDLTRLADGLPARVVPAEAPRIDEFIPGSLSIGVQADPEQRTIDLFVRLGAVPTWARPGVAGFADVETTTTAAAVLAVPLAAVLQDGLQRVLFRRDNKDPDTVIRMEADLGADDGHWVNVLSGLADGDEIVLAGAYELVLASSGTQSKGGHFHADGTWHKDN